MRYLSMGRAFAAGFLTVGIVGVAAGAQDQGAKQEKVATARQEPSTLAISVPWQWLASTGGTLSFQCEASRPANDEGVRMIESLTRGGRKGRFAGKGDDGGTFTGTRSDEDFTFEAISKDGSKFVLQMPWLAARCIFGGAKLAGAPSIDLRARDLGGRLRLEVAGPKKGVSIEAK